VGGGFVAKQNGGGKALQREVRGEHSALWHARGEQQRTCAACAHARGVWRARGAGDVTGGGGVKAGMRARARALARAEERRHVAATA